MYLLGQQLVQIDSGPFGIVYGVDNDDKIYCRDGIIRSNPTGTRWIQVTSYGRKKYMSCGPKRCWGINKDDKIWLRAGVTPKNCVGNEWISVPGKLRQIGVQKIK